MKGNRGFALVVTLIVTTLMVALLVELIHQVYVDISLSRHFTDGQQASLLAESGITGGRKLLVTSLQNREYTSLNDTWAAPVKLDDETGAIEVVITEESGRININGLVQPNGEFDARILDSIKRLGARLSLPEELWSALADWMDTDDLPRSGGAESSYYRALNPPYSARNARLATLSEMSLVKGFTAEYIAALEPFVTVHAAPYAQVNINTAPREVLMALDEGIDERMAGRILEERRVAPFKALGELSRIPGGDTIANRLAGKASCRGTLFRIRSIARVRETARTVETVLRMSGSAPEILMWQEY